ncbi:oligosaccharide repeat unit polymerase [Chryseobacterium sp. GMJ5]|uniref:Oligosaccharide repeat unit polymerase n=1 Tax=Chryseobacterium gilvum TaxID=2976534 RepID=A0ABT2VYK7_9FLAO|nr:O-antigen polymerase [Chryseobacterium gilvum]MCU7615088.1 oligosaccharide repeat unit polymerase [Chryseobacterium gilvum]
MEFYILGSLFLLGLLMVARDFRKHFLILFILLIYFICFFLGPLNSVNLNKYTHLGGNFFDGFYDTLDLYSIGIFCLLTGYGLAFRFSKKRISDKRKKFVLNPNYKYYMWLFFLSLVSMIGRNVSEGVYGGGFFNYLVFLGDSLIIAFIILIYEKKFNKPWLWVLLAASLLCYMILGFRYRILLFIIGIIYHFVITNKLSGKTIIKWIFIGMAISYAINFITLNRTALKTLEFSDVTFESKVENGLSPYQLVMHQTDNYKTEMMIVNHMRNNNVEYDYGESMFVHILVRIIPATFFEGNKKPEIPQMNIIKSSFNSKEGRYAGAAVSNVIEYYIAFGLFGIIFFMTVLGIFLGYISKKTDLNVPRDRVIIVLIAMVMFQEITRGYLPQNVTLLVFLLITLKLFYKKQYVSNSNQHTNAV